MCGIYMESDTLTFDPHDRARIREQNAICRAYGPVAPLFPFYRGQPDYARISDVRAFAAACWHVGATMGLTDEFAEGVFDLAEAAQAEALQREREARRLARLRRRWGAQHWSTADLLAEIGAVAGEGQRRGGAWWFSCPLPGHPNGDRDPSLEVDPQNRVWRCWSRHGGGGVLDWRKAVGVDTG